MHFLSARQGDFDLGSPVFPVQPKGNDGKPLLLDPILESFDLTAMKQEFSRSCGFVIGAISVAVFGDVSADQDDFAVFHTRVRFHEAGTAVAKRLDLRALQDETRFERIEEEIVVPSPSIAGNELFAVRHLVRRPREKVAKERENTTSGAEEASHFRRRGDPPHGSGQEIEKPEDLRISEVPLEHSVHEKSDEDGRVRSHETLLPQISNFLGT